MSFDRFIQREYPLLHRMDRDTTIYHMLRKAYVAGAADTKAAVQKELRRVRRKYGIKK